MLDPVRNAEMLQTQILQGQWFLLDSHNKRYICFILYTVISNYIYESLSDFITFHNSLYLWWRAKQKLNIKDDSN